MSLFQDFEGDVALSDLSQESQATVGGFPVLAELGNESDLDADAELEAEVEPNWNQQFVPNRPEFPDQNLEINPELGLTDESSPLDILQEFITADMVETICFESDLYARQKQHKGWKPFEDEEYWRFVAVLLNMGVVKKQSLKEYWSTKELILTPFFGKTMPRDRFMMILRSIHYFNNENIPPNNTDRFIKMGTFMNNLISNFKRSIIVGEYLCLDESLVPFKGRLSIKQYNPKKRSRFGVKLFVLADCASKLIIDVLPYQGKATKLKDGDLVKDLGFGGAAVATMLKPYYGKHHRVVIDNWFNSPKLARLLQRKQTYVLGTVQKSRKDMPKGPRMQKKLQKGDVEVFSDGNMLIERWSDRREVLMLNSFMSHVMIDSESPNPLNRRPKPGTVLLYNAKMGVVDDADKVIKPCQSIRKSYKWYRKVSFHLLDIAVYNSMLIYERLQNKKIAYKDFLMDLISCILEKYPPPLNLRGRPPANFEHERLRGMHLPVQVIKPNGAPSKSNCYFCFFVHGKRSSTTMECNKCKKRLCVKSCFFQFHTVRHLKKFKPPQPVLELQNNEIEYTEELFNSEL